MTGDPSRAGDAAQADDTAVAGGYDAELRRYDPVLRSAAAVRRGERVLDIGCGAGRTTRDAARASVTGRALGVDVSAPAIARARATARTEGPDTVAFEEGDAQVHPLPSDGFDVAISRFGTMFFDDPVAAFGNVRRALAPAGRLAMLVWQAPGRNAWHVELRAALDGPDGPADARGPASGPRSVPDPFSLGEPDVVRAVLRAAGFADVALADVREPLCFGPDVPSALAWVRGFTCTASALAGLDADATARALDRLRATLAGHQRDDGVWFDGRAWLVTARRDA
ncbi:class I SAM-dependent methyltransferase [Cellulomonas sp. NS3]|uniref:class I SAM-dependent methyltransferase n=1 Tax=Cellulomonas sp. NS3 TaxID=2973977 RepID=UPI0021620F5C|nr:class I SAM-dependent methyltransferase [Cellulomonas sp. NS3]